jgi:AraC-like DNA-binding protein
VVCDADTVRSPGPVAPTLADALRHVSISGLFYCPSFLRAPWGGTLPPMPGCVWFHAVTSGGCELVVDGERHTLVTGDLALVPHGNGHRIEAGEPAEFPLIPELPHEDQRDNYAVLRYGSAHGPLTELVCGGLRLEHPSARRVLDALPPSVHVRAARGSAVSAVLDLLAEEVHRQEVGGEAVISRLCDIVVIHAIRHWLASDASAGSPWLRALDDPQLGPALAALHADPAAPWTVGRLASVAAMSRSAFAARFRDLLGQPVMQYVTEVRMQLALDLLRRGEHTITQIAGAVGYESEASFGRVFKRQTGSSPRHARLA